MSTVTVGKMAHPVQFDDVKLPGSSGEPPSLFPDLSESIGVPAQARKYPQFRYMGSKHRLIPWLHSIFSSVPFTTVADPFCGSGSVSYLLKAMGKSVHASDFLNFPAVIASSVVANSATVVTSADLEHLLSPGSPRNTFITETFGGIFFSAEDLQFLDVVWDRLGDLSCDTKRHLVLAAMIRSCMKKQPRGVFTVGSNITGGEIRYDDGRRDVRLSLRDHFDEQVSLLNALVFSNGKVSTAERKDALRPPDVPPDLVYLDPPYVPRHDDNCYIKRYHFLEGLSTYWQDGNIMKSSKVRKLAKRHTPFSHRHSALSAFDDLFRSYAESTIALSYSSNGYPDAVDLVGLLRKYKTRVEVFERSHRYHFGTHAGVTRAVTTEYVLLGLSS